MSYYIVVNVMIGTGKNENATAVGSDGCRWQYDIGAKARNIRANQAMRNFAVVSPIAIENTVMRIVEVSAKTP